jgi:uncharacterized protein (TIGR02117 family)
VAFIGACVGPVADLYPPPSDGPAIAIWVVSHGWHTGLVVPWEAVPGEIWPERDDYHGARYLEVGWGDRDFYQAQDPTLGLAIKATFWPTPSAVHVVALNQPPASFFSRAEIVELELTPQGFARLCAFIAHAYARDEHGRAIPLGPGLYGVSQFYLGRESYFLTTCNVWTARALRSAGLPISPIYALTAGNVMFQAKRFGRVMGPR